MLSDRKLIKEMQERFFDMELLMQSTQEERSLLFQHMYEKAKSGMTAEEIDAVKERVARAKRN